VRSSFSGDSPNPLSGDLDTLPKPAPTIVLGPSSLESIGPGHPKDPNASWPASWLEQYTFIELPSTSSSGPWTGRIASVNNDERVVRKWAAVGCFDKGVDWYGDGSLWFVDAPGVSTETSRSASY
jgi:hypothetical protein